MSYKKVFLKPGKEESLKRFHPWVFSGAIARVEGEPEEGEVVDVYTSKKEFIACGHFQIGSIAVRVLSFRQEPIDHAFWVRRLQVAKDLRCALGVLGNPQNNTYRLVHGEGDNLPGLIIDVYDHTAVMQAHSAGMHLDRMAVAEALEEVMGDVIQHIYYKSETTLPFKADLLATENGFLKGGSPENVAMENGLKFHVDWLKGQKTGFFVDQRENRALLERYAKGRNVLNMFCYTGGFSFYAMRGGANLVHSVDSSANRRYPSPGFCGRCLQVPRPHGRPVRPDYPRPAGLCQAPRCPAQCPSRLHQAQCQGLRKDTSGRYPLHLLLFAGGEQAGLP